MTTKISKIGARGRTFTGVVISDRMPKTATVEWEWWKHVPKFERYLKTRTRVKAHNEVGAKKGDLVKIQECRPLSKTKNFIITEVLGHERLFAEREARLEESKKPAKEEEQ